MGKEETLQLRTFLDIVPGFVAEILHAPGGDDVIADALYLLQQGRKAGAGPHRHKQYKAKVMPCSGTSGIRLPGRVADQLRQVMIPGGNRSYCHTSGTRCSTEHALCILLRPGRQPLRLSTYQCI